MKKSKRGKAEMNLKQRLVFTVGILLVCTIFIQSTVSYISLSQAYDQLVAQTESSLDTMIKNEVQSIISVLQANYNRAMNAGLSKDEARSIGEGIVRNTRYTNGEGKDKGYFWADDASGKCVIHMNTEYQGKERFDNKDVKGNYYIQNLIKAGNKSDGGFTDFWFTKPGKQGDFQKRGYTAKFEPYGWYISTGNYTEDMEKIIAPQIAECKSQRAAALAAMLVCSAAFIAIGLFVIIRLSNKITKPLVKVTNRLEDLSHGDLHSPVPQISGKFETAVLAQAAGTTVTVLSGIIEDIENNLSKLSNGDFHIQLEHDYPGDTLPIKEAIRKIADSLNETLQQIEISSVQVSSGAGQVSSGSQELSQGTAEQASSIEQLSTSVAEISEQVQQNAGYAENADKLVIDMGQKIETSSSQMQELTAAINEISDSSNQISKIIKTIEDIAFQTNILALNAAVEAARAGEAGKGFAVVADEVRNLASKSAEAAKNTTILIEGSVRSVEKGTDIAAKAADSLQAVVEGSEKVVNLVDDISKASRNQAASIEQINNGVEQISSVVQTNSATAEESAAASEELSGQAEVLKELVSKFRFVRTKEKSASPKAVAAWKGSSELKTADKYSV